TPLWEKPDLGARLAAGEPYPGSARPVRRETISVDVLTGEPQALAIVPGPSWLPFNAAVLTGAVFLSLLFKVYWLTPLALVAFIAISLVWARSTGAREEPQPVDIGSGVRLLPHHGCVAAAPGRSGLLYALVADATLLASLLFGYVFLWTVAPNWPPPEYVSGHWPTPLVGAAGLIVAAWPTRLGVRPTAAGDIGKAARWLQIGAIAGAGATAAFAILPTVALPPATSHAYAAVSTMICYYISVHALI